MRHATSIFVLIFALCGTSFAQEGSSRVDFKVTNYPDTIVYVGYHFGGQKYLLDTLEVNNDQFVLQTDAVGGVYFLYSPKFYFEFILERGDYSITTDAEALYQDLKVENSAENSLFKDFQLMMIDLQGRQRKLAGQLAETSGEDSLALRKEITELSAEMSEYRNELIASHEGLFISEFLSLMNSVQLPEYDELPDSVANRQSYFYLRDHYFDDIDFSNPELLRTPLLHSKVMEYFDRVLIQAPDSLNAGLDLLFTRIEDNDEMFRYWLVMMFKKYAESKIMGMDAVMVHLAKNYYLTDRVDWITEEYRKQLNEEVAYLQHSLIGMPAPPIGEVVDTLMQPVYMDQVSSPYTLLFIYDPDCGHCKETIEHLETYDEQLLELGVQVFALCTTTDVDRWKKFVATSNPEWVHAIDPGGKNYFRVYYNVRSTPQVYLLDESKKIVAKKLDIEQFIDLVKNMEGV